MKPVHSARLAQLAVVVLHMCCATTALAVDRAPEPAAGNEAVTALAAAPDHRHVCPVVRDNLRPSVLRSLALAYPVAVAKVRTVASCRALFERLGVDPVQSLMNSRYRGADRERAKQPGPCQRGVAAVTAVGSADVRLCLSFGSLPVPSAAVIVLHEALHYAGLDEWPSSPKAMTAGQISLMVRDACGL